MDQWIAFWTFSDPNAVWVLLGSTLLGFAAGFLGCFPFLKKRALVGDALAHAALPGVTTAFLLFQSKTLFLLLSGAVVSCLIAYFVIDYLVRYTRVKEDSAFAMVLSVFFALGIFQLTLIQKLPSASQAGLDKFLFGQAGALVGSDVYLLISVSVALVLVVLLFYRGLKYVTFDAVFCRAIGVPVDRYEFLLALLVVVTVAVGMQLVGVVLMAAALLIPPSAARYWTDDLRKMLLLSGLFGGVAGAFGAFVSYTAPRMPTGPWMVIGCVLFFAVSVLFAPKRGAFARFMKLLNYKRRLHEENVLRSLYLAAGEGSYQSEQVVDASKVLQHRSISVRQFEKVTDRLGRKGLIQRVGGGVALNKSGFEYAERLTRLHRLWELYLTEQTSIAADHVHDDAEEIEHILTEELEAEILRELGVVAEDPHGKVIPGGSDD
jgi:manganese/zinc/iron transport system permease protein